MPEAVPFQTKAALALALLDEATACGVGQACVTGDADYGDTPHFLNGREERQARHVVAVRAPFRVHSAGASTGTGSISGVISPPTRRWPCWSSMRLAATGWSTIRRKRKRSWAGINIKGGAGGGFIGTRLRCC